MHIDLSFRLQGRELPADHGYRLHSAISGIWPEVHGAPNIGIHPISGRPLGNRLISLTPSSRLTIRLPNECVSQALVLAGKTLMLGEHTLRVGMPTPYALQPAAALYSRLVVIKGFLDPDAFLEAIGRQLKDLGIKGRAALVEQNFIAAANVERTAGTHSPVLRRTLRIHDKEVVGFAVRVSGLTADESVKLQERGIGGRRRFGCGVFIPDRR